MTAAACDLAIIGSGPGGIAAALTAARRGLKVALIEREWWGGVCLNVGCIPTKALITVAKLKRRIHGASALGLHVEGLRVDYPAVMARNARIITTLRRGVAQLLQRAQVELISGEAAFEDAHALVVRHGEKTQKLSAQRFIIAVGSHPHPGPWGFDGARRLSYRDALQLSELPASMLIIGGGVIGCEFASCFSNFGVAVTIVEQESQLLPGEDPEAVNFLSQRLQANGVTILTGTTIETLTTTAAGVQADLSNGTQVTASQCLIAVGLVPNTDTLGLSRIGLETDEGRIVVTPARLTRQSHIAAIGDCIEGPGLAHMASAEGAFAVDSLMGLASPKDWQIVPRCVYTDPELAQVGLTEVDAPPSARISRFAFAALGKSLCDEESEGFVKLIVEAETDRVLGGTIVGVHASDMIHLIVLAMTQGLTAKQLARTITAHPTWPEAVTEAAAQIYGESLASAHRVRAPRVYGMMK
ncbi:MAG: dihydrolipoyl dehydrogenase [Candidatus Omnitrophica bacterium]|nr:dihydrolipoyl dehydrogenase [Candidatus Omnitrophota bacterium]